MAEQGIRISDISFTDSEGSRPVFVNESVLIGNEIFVLSGERPAQILEHISNTEPHAERNLESESSMNIEKRLYHLLS